jgi:hypothetical protein
MAVKQVSVIRMIVNLKSARALGFKVPDPIRLRADEMID